MRSVNQTSIVDQFRAALEHAGIEPPAAILDDGELHRFPTNGKAADDSGWYVLHGDGIPAGAFGDWRTGGTHTFRADIGRELTREELDAHRVRLARIRAERDAEREREHAANAARAAEIWESAELATDAHPYLQRKRVKAHGLRLHRGALVVPLRADGKLWSLQFIATDGTKLFLTGGRTRGCSHAIGSGTPTVCVVEGFATGASVHEATGHAVAVAFSASNLRPVAEGLRAEHPGARIIIAGDNDTGGTGQRAALEAARAVGGIVAIPPTEGRDWNDVTAAEGLEVVRTAIEAAQAPDASDPQPAEAANASPERGDTASRRTSRTVAAGATPLMRPIAPPEPYPVDALGPVLAPAARALAELVQVPEALAAGCVLATAGLVAQKQANVQTLGGARPLALFVLTVAGSGDRKTAADKVALAPVDEHVRKMHASYEAELAEWERAKEAGKLDRANARKAAGSGDEYAEALREIAAEPKPRKPWIVCSEPTAEGLVKSLADGQYAQGIFTDEGGQFIGGHALSEEAELRTIAMLSRLWQGDRIDRVRATDSEHVVLYGRRLSMHLLVQPDVATRMLGKSLYRSQGFLARWLMAGPDSLAGTRLHNPTLPDPADDPRMRRFWHALGELLAAPANEDREVGGLDPPCLALTPEARSLLVQAYDEIEVAQARDGALEGVREWASKAAEHACRIAGVLTLTSDPMALAVTAETMAGALELTQFYLSEYVRLVGSADVPENIRHAQELLTWLRQKKRATVTARDVMRLGPGRAIRHGDAAKAALRTLAEHGWLTTEDGKTYVVNQAALAEDAAP